MRDRESKALKLVQVASQKSLPQAVLDIAAMAIEQYARQNIPETSEAYGQFMYHAQLLRNNHLDTYLVDLHLVAQPYHDILVEIFSELEI